MTRHAIETPERDISHQDIAAIFQPQRHFAKTLELKDKQLRQCQLQIQQLCRQLVERDKLIVRLSQDKQGLARDNKKLKEQSVLYNQRYQQLVKQLQMQHSQHKQQTIATLLAKNEQLWAQNLNLSQMLQDMHLQKGKETELIRMQMAENMGVIQQQLYNQQRTCLYYQSCLAQKQQKNERMGGLLLEVGEVLREGRQVQVAMDEIPVLVRELQRSLVTLRLYYQERDKSIQDILG